MGVEFPDLADLDEATVDNVFNFIAQFVHEKHPDLDARRGMLGDLVCGLHAMLQGAGFALAEQLRKSSSIAELRIAPEMSAISAVDAIASNYRVTRKPAVHATGQVTIVLSTYGPVTVLCGEVFTAANGQTFTATRTYRIRHGDEALDEVGAGRRAFMVDVEAVTPGVAASLRSREPLTPTTVMPGFVGAYATAAFSRGRAVETNEELLARLHVGVTARGFGSRESIRALILNADRPGFADISDISIIGMGDREMVRDQINAAAISCGGKIDIYLRDDSIQLAQAVQEYLDQRDIRHPSADVRVYPAIPCTVAVDIRLHDPDGHANHVAIAEVAARFVNGLPFGSVLYEASVSKTVYSVLPAGVEISAIGLSGDVLIDRKTVEVAALHTAGKLEIPDCTLGPSISPRTVAFMLSTGDVNSQCS